MAALYSRLEVRKLLPLMVIRSNFTKYVTHPIEDTFLTSKHAQWLILWIAIAAILYFQNWCLVITWDFGAEQFCDIENPYDKNTRWRLPPPSISKIHCHFLDITPLHRFQLILVDMLRHHCRTFNCHRKWCNKNSIWRHPPSWLSKVSYHWDLS